MSSPPEITVVGAGVSGLTTAHALLERGHRVRVVAEALTPGTTSDVPAALWYPFKVQPFDRALGWARATHARLRALAGDAATGVVWRDCVEVFRWKADDPWWKDAVTGFTRARPQDLPPGTVDGYVFETPVIETPVYMPWLLARVRTRGARFEQRRLTCLEEAVAPGGVAVNCAGLGSRELARDPAVFPSKGQLVHLAPFALERVWLDEAVASEITYVVPRRDGIVLGGTVEDGIESTTPERDATAAILARARRLVPALAGARVERIAAGVRPCRSAVRLEAERLDGGRTVVHDYGHGGAGFTLSWGAAAEAADLVEKAIAACR